MDPISSFKKRSIRPSSSSSSIRSLAGSPSTPTLSKEIATNDGAEEDEGNVAVVRARGKKSAVGRVKDREGTKKTSRLSFGGEEEDVSLLELRYYARGRLTEPDDFRRRAIHRFSSNELNLRDDY